MKMPVYKSEEYSRGKKIVRWLKVFGYSLISLPTLCCFGCGCCGTCSGPEVLYDEEMLEGKTDQYKRITYFLNQAIMPCFTFTCLPACGGCCLGCCGWIDPADAFSCMAIGTTSS